MVSKKPNPSSYSSFADGNTLLLLCDQSRMARLTGSWPRWPDGYENSTNQSLEPRWAKKKKDFKAHNIEPWDRSAIMAEYHVGFPSCQQESESTVGSEIGRLPIGKKCHLGLNIPVAALDLSRHDFMHCTPATWLPDWITAWMRCSL